MLNDITSIYAPYEKNSLPHVWPGSDLPDKAKQTSWKLEIIGDTSSALVLFRKLIIVTKGTDQSHGVYVKGGLHPWVKVFRINLEFRILRLTFHRKSASKS